MTVVPAAAAQIQPSDTTHDKIPHRQRGRVVGGGDGLHMAEEGGEAERGIRSKEGGGGELEGWLRRHFLVG